MDLIALAGLAASAFLAATLLPASSEAVLAGLIVAKAAPVTLLLAVASLANVAGASVNWLLGRALDRLKARRWFPVGPAELARAQAWYQRYGIWSLLACWVPIIGDPLTVVAGVMRTPLHIFLPLVAAAKTARYAAIAWLVG
jgi:membrane protein YqaA with SNARE-associated domain